MAGFRTVRACPQVKDARQQTNSLMEDRMPPKLPPKGKANRAPKGDQNDACRYYSRIFLDVHL